MTISSLVKRNLDDTLQNVAFFWWPIDLRMAGPWRRGWLRLPAGLVLSIGLEPDYDERLVLELGTFRLTRAETDQERQEREDAEAEIAFMEHEMNRYTEWYY